jgi:hypothetical protein
VFAGLTTSPADATFTWDFRLSLPRARSKGWPPEQSSVAGRVKILPTDSRKRLR